MAEEEPVDEGSWHGVANSHVGVGYVNAGPFWQSGVKALTFKATDGTPWHGYGKQVAREQRDALGALHPANLRQLHAYRAEPVDFGACVPHARLSLCLFLSLSLSLRLSVSPSLSHRVRSRDIASDGDAAMINWETRQAARSVVSTVGVPAECMLSAAAQVCPNEV